MPGRVLRGVGAALRRRVPQDAQRGSAALFIAIFAVPMIFLAGLVIDGGAALEARQRAADIAEQAARAAGNQCDIGLLRSAGECRITSYASARTAAEPYTENNGVTTWNLDLIDPVPGAPGTQYYGVRVTVTMTFSTILLGIVPGYETLTVTQVADAVAVTGL
jgi:Flp pilus assembly protein TadG